MNRNPHAFTLVELLTVIAIVGVLASLLMVVIDEVRFHAHKAESMSNIRQLATAAELYASEHGHYAPRADQTDEVRWHGRMRHGKFTGQDGFLSPYLAGGEVRFCPVLKNIIGDDDSGFDLGAGGYGYNAAYVGGNPRALPQSGTPSWAQGSPKAYISHPATTVLFTSTAIAYGDTLAETDHSVPLRSVYRSGLGGPMTPTTHFRFRAKALVAWADGHVTLEEPNDQIDGHHNVYGGDNAAHFLGWFGPPEWNGYWNPRYRDAVPY